MDKDLDELIETVWLLRYQKQLHAKHGMPTEHDDILLDLALDRLTAEWRWRREHEAGSSGRFQGGVGPEPIGDILCRVMADTGQRMDRWRDQQQLDEEAGIMSTCAGGTA